MLNFFYAGVRIFAIALILSGAAHARSADFNADGKQDLVWRTHAGNPVIWQMNGFGVSSRTTLATALDSGSAIVGSGHLFPATQGGGILWIDSAHRLSIWRANNGLVQQSCVVANSIDPGWEFLGIGDLDADGIDDVLWRLPDGTVNAFLLNGCTAPVTVTLGHQADPAWTYAGAGTVDAQNAAVFWRQADGDIVLWRLHNGTAIFSTTLKADSFASWSIAAIADFDGDGKTDVLWRDPTRTQTTLWLMDDTKFTPATVVPASTSVFSAPDSLFDGGFDSGAPRAAPLAADAAIVAASDVNGDGRADVVIADARGDTSIWQMQGASVVATGVIPPSGDMPYTEFTGWRMAIDRPVVTLVDGTVSVAWDPIGGSPTYTVFASAANDPGTNGVPIQISAPSLTFQRDAAAYADKRYFAVSANYNGVHLPLSKEAYIAEFTPYTIPMWGAMAIDDINGDGCVDVLDALGDCAGSFQVLPETARGLDALYANSRAYRDLRYADFDGDGIEDLVSNVYSAIDAPSRVLMFRGTGSNQFVEDTDFSATDIRGYGETIVVADFNNDGYLDIYLPQYSMASPEEHSWMLLNDGSGHFSDISDLTGMSSDPDATVALRAVPSDCRVEAAQAVDLDNDGRIDLYVGNHLFLNQGNDEAGIPHFSDLGPRFEPSDFDPYSEAFYYCTATTPSPAGLPVFHDEGAKFIDLDNSGQLALVLNNGASSERGGAGIGVFKFDGLGQFIDYSDVIPHFYMLSVWGLNAADVDGDGLTDIILPGGCDASFAPIRNCYEPEDARTPPRLLVNRNGAFVQHDFYPAGAPAEPIPFYDVIAPADFDWSGTADFVVRTLSLVAFLNQASSLDNIIVSVVGDNGEHNQAGRVVRVSPVLRPSIVMTQVVDGGSGYLSNSQYELTFATPYVGAYSIVVRFAEHAYSVIANSGDHVTLRANGTYSVQ